MLPCCYAGAGGLEEEQQQPAVAVSYSAGRTQKQERLHKLAQSAALLSHKLTMDTGRLAQWQPATGKIRHSAEYHVILEQKSRVVRIRELAVLPYVVVVYCGISLSCIAVSQHQYLERVLSCFMPHPILFF